MTECRIVAVKGGRYVTAHGQEPDQLVKALRAVGFTVTITPILSADEVRESSRSADQVDDTTAEAGF